MKVFAFFLAWVNVTFGAVAVAIVAPVRWLSFYMINADPDMPAVAVAVDPIAWLSLTTWSLMIVVGFLTAFDMIQPAPRRMFISGLSLIILATACLGWGLHLILISRYEGGGMFFFGGSALVQGIASLWELMQSNVA